MQQMILCASTFFVLTLLFTGQSSAAAPAPIPQTGQTSC
jgi:hypothetical protein